MRVLSTTRHILRRHQMLLSPPQAMEEGLEAREFFWWYERGLGGLGFCLSGSESAHHPALCQVPLSTPAPSLLASYLQHTPPPPPPPPPPLSLAPVTRFDSCETVLQHNRRTPSRHLVHRYSQLPSPDRPLNPRPIHPDARLIYRRSLDRKRGAYCVALV